MPTIYFVRDGYGGADGDRRTDEGRQIDLNQAVRIAKGAAIVHHANTEPAFNGSELVNGIADFRHVVIEIRAGEADPATVFDRVGYFHLGGIDPAQANARLTDLH